jgi:DNA-binding transcriptional MerR regulator
MGEQTHTIGRLARKFQLSRSALRYYDSIGLLEPSYRAREAR